MGVRRQVKNSTYRGVLQYAPAGVNNTITMHVSVILSTYNRAKYLELSLLGYMRQTHKDFEVVIADDGSTDGTKALIERYQKLASFPIRHAWQEKEASFWYLSMRP